MYRHSLKEASLFQCCQKRCCHHRPMPSESRSYATLKNKKKKMCFQ